MNQLIMDLPCEESFDADDFVTGSSNSIAKAHIDIWPNWVQPSLFLSGPEGSGKSHLASLWCHRSGAVRVSASDFCESHLENLIRKRCFVIEDVDRSIPNENNLLHALNLVVEGGGSLLLTMRSAGALSLPVSLCDLRSRLGALPVVRMGPPDDNLLRGVVVKLLADRQIHIEAKDLDYMILRMRRSFHDAICLVSEIDRRSLAEKKGIRRSLVAGVLRDMGTQAMSSL